jgi:hypothetical protein
VFPALLAILRLLPVGSSAEPIRGTVLVMLQNDANVPANVAATAQAEVVRLFGLADMEVVWVTRVPTPGIRLRVISTVTWEPREEKMATVSLAQGCVAAVCAGPYAIRRFRNVMTIRRRRPKAAFLTEDGGAMRVGLRLTKSRCPGGPPERRGADQEPVVGQVVATAPPYPGGGVGRRRRSRASRD